MSLEQLKTDLKQFVESGAAAPPDRSVEGVWSFLANNLVPWLESNVTELEEMDEAIEEAYHETPDLLHAESSAVFASIIAAGLVLAKELRTRIGNDQRLSGLIKEFHKIAGEGSALLQEITIPDPEDDDDDVEDPEAPPIASAAAPAEIPDGTP